MFYLSYLYVKHRTRLASLALMIWKSTVDSATMSSKHVMIFLLGLFIVAAAKKEQSRGSRDRPRTDFDAEDRDVRKSNEFPTTTTRRAVVGDTVVEKFVETLMASERYLKMIQTVERKLNHLEATYHDNSNSILKHVSEILRTVKSSPSDIMEKALTGMKADLDRLKQTVTTRLGDHPTMRGKT